MDALVELQAFLDKHNMVIRSKGPVRVNYPGGSHEVDFLSASTLAESLHLVPVDVPAFLDF